MASDSEFDVGSVNEPCSYEQTIQNHALPLYDDFEDFFQNFHHTTAFADLKAQLDPDSYLHHHQNGQLDPDIYLNQDKHQLDPDLNYLDQDQYDLQLVPIANIFLHQDPNVQQDPNIYQNPDQASSIEVFCSKVFISSYFIIL